MSISGPILCNSRVSPGQFPGLFGVYIYGHFWVISGPFPSHFCAFSGSFLVHFRQFPSLSGSILGHFWAISGPFPSNFQAISVPFPDQFWVIYEPFLGYFRTIWRHLRASSGPFLDLFCAIPGSVLGNSLDSSESLPDHFWAIFGSFLDHFQFHSITEASSDRAFELAMNASILA